METEKTDKSGRDELFQAIKSKSQSRAKREVYLGLVMLIVIIVLLAFFSHRVQDKWYFLLFTVCVCLFGWLTLYSYRFKKRIDTLSPEQLLQCYVKKSRNERIFGSVSQFLGLIVCFYPFLKDFLRGAEIGYVIGILAFVVVSMAVVAYFFPTKISNTEEMIEELQELCEEQDG